MKRKNRVKNPIAHADGGVRVGKTFNRTVNTRQFPEIEPFIWDYGNAWNWSVKGGEELKIRSFAVTKNHAERIKEYLARNLVYDAISFLMSYDLTKKAYQESILQYYTQYFKTYPFDYLNEMLINITNEDVNLRSGDKMVIDSIDLKKILFEKIINDAYRAKIKEISEKVIKYQGGVYDPLTFQRANQKADEEGQKQEDEEPNIKDLSGLPELIVGIIDIFAATIAEAWTKTDDKSKYRLQDDEKEELTKAWQLYLKNSPDVKISPSTMLLLTTVIIYAPKTIMAIGERKERKEREEWQNREEL